MMPAIGAARPPAPGHSRTQYRPAGGCGPDVGYTRPQASSAAARPAGSRCGSPADASSRSPLPVLFTHNPARSAPPRPSSAPQAGAQRALRLAQWPSLALGSRAPTRADQSALPSLRPKPAASPQPRDGWAMPADASSLPAPAPPLEPAGPDCRPQAAVRPLLRAGARRGDPLRVPLLQALYLGGRSPDLQKTAQADRNRSAVRRLLTDEPVLLVSATIL